MTPRPTGALRCCRAGLGWIAALSVSSCGTNGDLTLGRLPVDTATDERGTATDDEREAGAEGTTANTADAALDSPADAGGGASSASPCEAPIVLPDRRFDFSGSGTEVIDRMGGQSGRLLGGALLSGDGAVELDGEDDYVDLPNGILGGQPETTLLLWGAVVDGPAYWRLLDFGTSSAGEDFALSESAVGTRYIALTPETGLDPPGFALLVGQGGASNEDRALTDLRLDETFVALAVVISDVTRRAVLYHDGQEAAATALSQPIAEFDDVNNWLGRSQYSADPFYPGRYEELRVYDRALSPCVVRVLTEAGPDDLGI